MKTTSYTQQEKQLPASGRHILAQTDGGNIIVYQAFNPNIAAYAIANQKFGGNYYRFNRMSWIKPGFLWMMYRAGWAQKEHQQRILAITLPLKHFKSILQQATISTYTENLFTTHELWKQELEQTEVRLQWDPDHDPHGNKIARRAIQLGLKGDILKKFCTAWITAIEDITPFVHEQYQFILDNHLHALQVPVENIVEIDDPAIAARIGLDTKIMSGEITAL